MIVVARKIASRSAIHFAGDAGCSRPCAAALIFLVWFPDPFDDDGRRHRAVPAGGGLRPGARPADLARHLQQPQEPRANSSSTTPSSASCSSRRWCMACGSSPARARCTSRSSAIASRSSRRATFAEPSSRRRAIPRYRHAAADRAATTSRSSVPAAEHNDALFEALDGNEEHHAPAVLRAATKRNWRAIRGAREAARRAREAPPGQRSRCSTRRAPGIGMPAERLRWLPVRHRNGFWTALIDTDNGKPLAYVDFDPY